MNNFKQAVKNGASFLDSKHPSWWKDGVPVRTASVCFGELVAVGPLARSLRWPVTVMAAVANNDAPNAHITGALAAYGFQHSDRKVPNELLRAWAASVQERLNKHRAKERWAFAKACQGLGDSRLRARSWDNKSLTGDTHKCVGVELVESCNLVRFAIQKHGGGALVMIEEDWDTLAQVLGFEERLAE